MCMINIGTVLNVVKRAYIQLNLFNIHKFSYFDMNMSNDWGSFNMSLSHYKIFKLLFIF